MDASAIPKRRATPTRVRGMSPAAIVKRKSEILSSTSLMGSLSLNQSADPRLSIRCFNSFEADLKTLLPIGFYVWASEKSGDISIRNANTGASEGIIVLKDDHCWSMLHLNGRIWSGHSKGAIRIWDAEGATKFLKSTPLQSASIPHDCSSFLIRELRESAGGIYCMTSSGNRIFTGSNDFTIKMYDGEKMEFVKLFAGHTNQVRCLTVYSRYLLSGSDDFSIRIWNIENGNCVGSLIGHNGGVLAICMVGSHIWSADDTGVVKVWDSSKNECIQELKSHSSRVGTITIVGRFVWTASSDRKICIWNPQTFQLVHSLSDHLGYVSDVSLMNQFISHTSWSVGNDKTVRMWKQELFIPLELEIQESSRDETNHLEIFELQESLKALQAQQVQQTSEHQNSIDILLQKNDFLSKKNVDMEKDYSELKRLNDELVSIVDHRDQIIARLQLSEQESNSKIFILESANEAEREKCNLLQTSLESVQGEYGDALREMKSANNALLDTQHKLNLEIDALKKQLESESQKASDLQVRLDVSQRISSEASEMALREKDEHTTFIQKLEDQLRRLDVRLKDEEARSAELLRKNAALESLIKVEREQSTQLRRDYESLTTVLNDRLITSTESMSTELLEMRTKYEDIITKYDALAALHEAESKQYWDIESELRLELETLQESFQVVVAEKEAANKQLSECQFVMKSRGDFLKLIWQLANDTDRAKNYVHDISNNTDVRAMLRTKRDVLPEMQIAKDHLDAMRNTFRTLVSQFFSEYEKLHLGISVYHYDPARLNERDIPRRTTQDEQTPPRPQSRSASRPSRPAWN
eukprot:TRINITY_DN2048_c0_g1_i2.p1 TRINITY_DN2048_c0_g1~~TRINITY_DN2048_c0_g1_i2.p1  ORF type:complete len:815 (-),score=168.03 TRINITY_DN2048_c0_g1_i2:252-2696(-)